LRVVDLVTGGRVCFGAGRIDDNDGTGHGRGNSQHAPRHQRDAMAHGSGPYPC
jgi:hypothetical protein